MTPRIYIASKSCHGQRWVELRASGAPIVSTWIDESGAGMTTDWADLFDRCVREAAWATCLICYSEPGEILKGALVEVGAALAHGVPVLWVGPTQNVTHHPLVTVCETLSDAFERVVLAECDR